MQAIQIDPSDVDSSSDATDEAARTKVLNEVSQLRDVIRSLGEKPDRETVDEARKSMAEIDSRLSRNLESIFMESCPDGVDHRDWPSQQARQETLAKEAAEKEKFPYKAVVQLFEMFEEYERLLNDAEQRLAKLTETREEGSLDGSKGDDEIDEEVVRVLQESSQQILETVVLKGRMLKRIPEAFGSLTALKLLDLSSNQIEILPDSIAGLTNLEELIVNANALLFLPDTIGFLKSLKILNVATNKLKALPDSISQCSALIELDASFNELTYLPTRMGDGLCSLQVLDVHLNKLRYLPSSLCEIRSLRVLNAHFNELRSLPVAIGNLQNLEVLNVSGSFTDLTSIPDTIGDLMNLVEIDLSNNQINELPSSFGRLTNLKKISLDQNPLVVPPQDAVKHGPEAIMEYMSKRWVDYLLEEERKSVMGMNETQSEQSWVQRGTQLVGGWLSGVTGGLSEYFGTSKNSHENDFLNQQL